MKRLTTVTGLLVLLAACVSTPDHLGTVREFQAAKNNGDLQSTLALFVEEPILHFGPLGTITGRTAVRSILEYDLALHTHLEFQNCTLVDAAASCRVHETNDWLKVAGIDSIEYDENKFTFAADGRIESVSASLSAASAQSLGETMAEFHQWATVNRPQEYAALFSEQGTFVYNGKNADSVLKLLSAWREETAR